MEELERHKVLPQHWHPWLADGSARPQLTPLQTTGSGDCLLNALALGMYGVQDRTQPISKGDKVHVQCVRSDGGDSNATSYIPCRVGRSRPTEARWPWCRSGAEEMVVPQSSILGECEPDSAAYMGHDIGGGADSSLDVSVSLGRRWATLRLLLSLAMRESSGAIFTRWARDRLANTMDEGFIGDDDDVEDSNNSSSSSNDPPTPSTSSSLVAGAVPTDVSEAAANGAAKKGEECTTKDAGNAEGGEVPVESSSDVKPSVTSQQQQEQQLEEEQGLRR